MRVMKFQKEKRGRMEQKVLLGNRDKHFLNRMKEFSGDHYWLTLFIRRRGG